MLREWITRTIATLRRRRLDQEWEEEMQGHLQMLEDRYVSQGMSREAAAHAARKQFGGLTQTTQDLRTGRSLPMLEALARDLRHAVRYLAISKSFTLSAALTFALGIGAASAVFAVLDTLVLRPLPFSQADRILAVRSMRVDGAPRPAQLSYPDFFDFRSRNQVFEHLVSYRDATFASSGAMPAEQVEGQIVAWDLFPALGVQLALGRGFLPEEEKPGTHVAVLSHSFWERRFHRDSAILGSAIRLNGAAFTVVGIAPAGFRFPVDVPSPDVWVTLAEDGAATAERGARMLDAIGVLKPGIELRQAQAQLDAIASANARQYPESANYSKIWLQPEAARLAGGSSRPLYVLLGAVAMLLLISCSNVANLLLARNAARQREYALRTALGASRASIVRQALIESLMLGLLGGAGGLLLAGTALRTIVPLAAPDLPSLLRTSIDWRVLGFSFVLALVTSLLFSLAPAFQAARSDPSSALKEGARGVLRGHDRFRGGLVVLQVTLSLILLLGSELLMGTFLRMARRDPGFRTDHLLTFNVGLPNYQYTPEKRVQFSSMLIERVRAIPGVQSAAAGSPLPLRGNVMRIAFDIDGRPAAPANRPRSDAAIVTPGFFHSLGIPLLQGRDFTERDNGNAPPVVIVNQAFARKFFPEGSALGKRIRPGAGSVPSMREIAGIVGNARQSPFALDADPVYYFPYQQLPWDLGTIVIRTAVPPLDVEAAARNAVAGLDSQAPVYQVRTGEALAAGTLARMRFLIALVSSFAALALLLTGTGLYGLLSYSVARRRGEIGVRVALGAGRKQVLGLVFAQAMRLVAAGLLAGIALALSAGRLLKGSIDAVQPGDPLILAIGCAVLALTGFAAAYVPAARAASVDPMQALRSE